MKKNVFLVPLIVIAFILCSCTDEDLALISIDQQKIELSEEEYTSIAFDYPKEIPQSDLYAMIESFISQNPEKNQTRSTYCYNYRILSRKDIGKICVGSERTRSERVDSILETRIPCYEVLVENGNESSYVLVSADERAPGILVYFPKFPTTEEEIDKALSNPNTKAILTMSQMQIAKDVNSVEQNKKLYRQETIKKICSQLNIPLDDFCYDDVKNKLAIKDRPENKTRSGNAYYSIPTQVLQYRTAIQTPLRWWQYAPYNRALDMDSIRYSWSLFPEYDHVPAGCATIAIANLESIIQRSVVNGVAVNWTTLRQDSVLYEAVPGIPGPSSPSATLTMAGNLIEGIYDALGSEPLRDNDGYVTSTNALEYDVFDYIEDNFNCSYRQWFNPDSVLTSLLYYRPVFVSGLMAGDDGPGTEVYEDGHMFIIDGFVIAAKNYQTNSYTNTRSVIVQNYDMYWHVNLGWGPCSAAYFKLDSNTHCTIDFPDSFGRNNWIYLQYQKIVTNIRTKS